MTTLNADTMLKVLGALVRDAEDILELGEGSLEADFQVVSQSVKSRGIDVLLIDMPTECKALEKALETGRLKPRHGSPFTNKGFPRLWLPIYSRLFDCNQWILHRSDPQALRVLRQLLKGYKKYTIACPQSATQRKIDEFRSIEDSLPTPQLNWGGVDLYAGYRNPSLIDMVSGGRCQISESKFRVILDRHEDLTRDISCIQYVADKICAGFEFSQRGFRPKHGPGAVSEPYRDSKFEFPTWPERLERVFPYAEWGQLNLLDYSDTQFEKEFSPAKLIDVPKDYSGPRLIASEPISAQYIQQGLMKFLRTKVSKSVLRKSISFSSQDPSRELALRSSLDRGFATIDLSSASDRLTCALVECIFRRAPGLLSAFNAARTHHLVYPDGSVVELKKFAAQGAAFTFPVQTIVYTIICLGVLFSQTNGTLAQLAGKVRVYGDDIIVPTHVFDRVCDILEVFSLKVNHEKSFSSGFFRESCGMDAYYGVDVTSSSIRSHFDRRDPKSLVSVVECANNLYQKGFIRGSSALLETVPPAILRKIPVKGFGSTAFGLIGGGKRPLPVRYNVSLHRTEVRCLDVAIKVTKTSPSGRLSLFQWFVEKPDPEAKWAPGEVKAVKARYRLRWVDERELI